MRLIQFINNRTEELMHEQDLRKTYSQKRDAESAALKIVLTGAFHFIKYFMIFKVIGQYLAVNFGLLSRPGTPVTEKKIADRNCKLKKIGMKDLKSVPNLHEGA